MNPPTAHRGGLPSAGLVIQQIPSPSAIFPAPAPIDCAASNNCPPALTQGRAGHIRSRVSPGHRQKSITPLPFRNLSRVVFAASPDASHRASLQLHPHVHTLRADGLGMVPSRAPQSGWRRFPPAFDAASRGVADQFWSGVVSWIRRRIPTTLQELSLLASDLLWRCCLTSVTSIPRL